MTEWHETVRRSRSKAQRIRKGPTVVLKDVTDGQREQTKRGVIPQLLLAITYRDQQRPSNGSMIEIPKIGSTMSTGKLTPQYRFGERMSKRV